MFMSCALSNPLLNYSITRIFILETEKKIAKSSLWYSNVSINVQVLIEWIRQTISICKRFFFRFVASSSCNSFEFGYVCSQFACAFFFVFSFSSWNFYWIIWVICRMFWFKSGLSRSLMTIWKVFFGIWQVCCAENF